MGVLRRLDRQMRRWSRPEGKSKRGLLRSVSTRVDSMSRRLDRVEEEVASVKILVAEPLAQRSRSLPPGTPLPRTEFRVFSQFGEDGILQHLDEHVPGTTKSFVEFGVEDFREANCRYLVERESWEGLVMDSDAELEAGLRRQRLYGLRNLRARSALVTAENVNQLLRDAGFEGDLRVLSIDIDGNDYWVWQAIDVVSPRIVVIEYNSVFGAERSVAVPYDPRFDRRKAHYSWLYAGASLPALVALARDKGYAFVGSNSAGNNAFFVRDDCLGSLCPLEARVGYVVSCFRESRGPEGQMTYLGGKERIEPIRDLPLVDVASGESITVGDLV